MTFQMAEGRALNPQSSITTQQINALHKMLHSFKLPDPAVSYLQNPKRQRYATMRHIHDDCRRARFPCCHACIQNAMRRSPPSNISHAIRLKPLEVKSHKRHNHNSNQRYPIHLSIITLRARPVLLWTGARRSATAAVLPRSTRSSLRARLPASTVLSSVARTSVVVAGASVGGDTAAHALSPCTRAESVHHHV